MCSGVVYDHFGHDVIFVPGTSGLLAFDFAEQAVFLRSLQISLTATPCGFGRRRVESEVQNLAGRWIGHRGDVSHGVAIHAHHASRLEARRGRSVIRERSVPLPAPHKELGGDVASAVLVRNARVNEDQRKNLFLEESRDANARTLNLNLPLFVATVAT